VENPKMKKGHNWGENQENLRNFHLEKCKGRGGAVRESSTYSSFVIFCFSVFSFFFKFFFEKENNSGMDRRTLEEGERTNME
jgi:hypothetical protein